MEQLGQLVLQVSLETMDQRELLVLPDLQAHKVFRELLVLQAHKEQLEIVEQLEQLVLQV
jgi:hypothetical protein